jgi:hypothetical protein
MSDEKRENLVCQTLAIPAQKSLSQFLHFSCAAYVEVQRGTGILLVSHDPENAKIDEFGLNQRVHINPNIYFAFVATTPELVVNVYVDRNHHPAYAERIYGFYILPFHCGAPEL